MSWINDSMGRIWFSWKDLCGKGDDGKRKLFLVVNKLKDRIF